MSLPDVRFDISVKSNNDAKGAQGRVLVLSHNRVIVVGAGPVGLVTALLLAEEGIPVTVLESDSTLSDDLRASTFHPPTLDMLDSLGLTERLLEQGLICPEWQIRMHATGEKAVFRLALIDDLTNHPYRLQCEQAKLCTLLVEKLSQHESATLHFGAKVIGLRQHADHVEVSAKLGDSKGCSDFTGRFVVGADGASSTVRTLLGLEFHGSTYPEITVLVSTPFPFHEHIDDISNVSYCWSPSGNFALLRLKEFWRCSLYYDPDLTFEAATAPERIQDQLQEIHASTDPFSIVDARPYRVHQRIVSNYRSGRVLLVGDAAHVNSPSGGMGMNGGIHDAFNLVEKLSRVWLGAGPELLDQYTRQRLPVAKSAILEQSDRNRKRMTQKDPDARARALASLQATAADQALARDYLIKSSMIDGLREARAIQ